MDFLTFVISELILHCGKHFNFFSCYSTECRGDKSYSTKLSKVFNPCWLYKTEPRRITSYIAGNIPRFFHIKFLFKIVIILNFIIILSFGVKQKLYPPGIDLDHYTTLNKHLYPIHNKKAVTSPRFWPFESGKYTSNCRENYSQL